LGNVLLPYGPAAERKRVLSLPMKPFAPKTITDARRLMQQQATVHEQGTALDSEEITRGIIRLSGRMYRHLEHVTGGKPFKTAGTSYL